MTLILPFRALRPAPGRAAEILAPPYDVLTSAEARARAQGKPHSFLHISKPEIDLDPAIDPYDRAVYAKAAENLKRMIASGVLMRDAKPCYYVYRLTARGRTQTGLAAVASLADYATNRIRKHELTTPLKEDDRVRQIEAINAETGPVMLAYPAAPQIDAMLATAARGADVDVTADDGVRHELWVIGDDDTIGRLTREFDALPALYIADGHHRSAAAARVAQARDGKIDLYQTGQDVTRSFHPPPHPTLSPSRTREGEREEEARAKQSASEGEGVSHATGRDSKHWAPHRYFLAVLFPHHEMTILDYNRVLKDLHGRSPDQLLAELRKSFSVAPSDQAVRPAASGEFGMYLAGRWYKLTLRPDLVPSDPIGRLPITLLSRHVIEPLFGITDPRTDKRIDFVGGGRGLEEIERRVAAGDMQVAFALYPTQMADLMAVADAGGIMPPKSTWFEPKLADGMVSHVLD